MGNGRKQTALWLVFVEGAALSLGIYLLLTVLLSALVVKAVLPEEGSFPAVAASCCGVLRRGHAQRPPLLLGQPGQRHGERRRLSAGGGGCGAAVLAADHLAGPRGRAAAVRRRRGTSGGPVGRAPEEAEAPSGPQGPQGLKEPLVNFTKNTDLSPAAETAATVGRSPAAGETAAANVGRRRFYVYKILSFFGAGEVISHADFTKLT